MTNEGPNCDAVIAWLREMPAERDITQTLILSLLSARGAVDENTMVPTDQMHAFEEWCERLCVDLAQIGLMCKGLTACAPSEDDRREMAWWLTEAGKQHADQLGQRRLTWKNRNSSRCSRANDC